MRLGIALADRPGDGVHQVGLAQADAAIEEQRVEARAGRAFRHAAGAGMGEFVRLADDEGVEGEARLQRHDPVGARLGRAELGRARRRGQALGQARGLGPQRCGTLGVGRLGGRGSPGRLGGRLARPPGRRGSRRGGRRRPRPATARAGGRRNGCSPSRAGSAWAAGSRLRHHRCPAASSAAARCGTRPRRPRHAGARGCGPSRRPSVRTSQGAIRRPPSAPNACRRTDNAEPACPEARFRGRVPGQSDAC